MLLAAPVTRLGLVAQLPPYRRSIVAMVGKVIHSSDQAIKVILPYDTRRK